MPPYVKCTSKGTVTLAPFVGEATVIPEEDDDVTVTFAVPCAPEPLAAVAVMVAVPVVAPAVKTQEVTLLHEARVPSPLTDQFAARLDVKVNCVPSTTDCDEGVTVSVDVDVPTVIVTFVVTVVPAEASFACSASVWVPVASEVTI